MIIKKTQVNDCLLLLPKKNIDKRGSFHRSYCEKILKKKGINFKIKQCNISINKKRGTLRGFHYQSKPFRESKIISVLSGSIFNVTIDLRNNSDSFLKKIVNKINFKSGSLLLIPAGCANAFYTMSNNTVVQYYMNQFFEDEDKTKYRGFRYNDKLFNIKWPGKPSSISVKDKSYQSFDRDNI